MKVTAIEEYGLRCMLFLARQSDGNSLTLPEFAENEGVSIPYAGKLLMILKKSGLVKAVRGRRGGYALARGPENITLQDIFEVLGQPVFSYGHCDRFTGENEICIHSGDCSIKSIWQTFEGLMESVLKKVTLADLAAGNISTIENLGTKIGLEA